MQGPASYYRARLPRRWSGTMQSSCRSSRCRLDPRSPSGPIQDGPHPGRQFGDLERLGDDVHAGGQVPVADGSVLGIASDEEDLQVGPCRAEVPRRARLEWGRLIGNTPSRVGCTAFCRVERCSQASWSLQRLFASALSQAEYCWPLGSRHGLQCLSRPGQALQNPVRDHRREPCGQARGHTLNDAGCCCEDVANQALRVRAVRALQRHGVEVAALDVPKR